MEKRSLCDHTDGQALSGLGRLREWLKLESRGGSPQCRVPDPAAFHVTPGHCLTLCGPWQSAGSDSARVESKRPKHFPQENLSPRPHKPGYPAQEAADYLKTLLRRLVTFRRPSGKQPSLRIHFRKPTEPPPRWQGQDFLRAKAEPSGPRPWGGSGRWRAGGAGRRDVGTLSSQLLTPLGDTARGQAGFPSIAQFLS